MELNRTKEELTQLFQDALEAINLDLEVAKKVTAQETCGDIANLGIETSRSFTLDPINEKGIYIQPAPSMTSLVCSDPSKMVCSDPPTRKDHYKPF